MRSAAKLLLLMAPSLLGGSNLAAAATLAEATAIIEGVEDLRGEVELWPGFEPWSIPVAIFDGERTYLLGHPSPPEEFQPAAGHEDIYVLAGRHEAVVANSSTKIGEARTATLMLESLEESSLSQRVEILVHESFHVFQRERHPRWSANEAALFLYPMDEAEGLFLRRLEVETLRRALSAQTSEASACRVRSALATRDLRFSRLSEEFSEYERLTELNEGLATYVGHRAVGKTGTDLFDQEFDAAAVRLRAYETGAAFGHLLDRFSDRWQDLLEDGDERALDELLRASLPTGEACDLPALEIEAIRAAASRDAEALRHERAEKERTFLAQSGWRVLITAPEPLDPLFLEGFDPINVASLGSGKILHERFLKLGNSEGSVEVMGRTALSSGPGPHPLFNGVRTLLATGIEREPSVEVIDGVATVQAEGLMVRLRGSIERSGQSVEVRLAPGPSED